MTGNRVLAFFLVATVLLIPLGAAILAASLSVTEYKIRYDNVGTGFDSSDKSVQQQALWAGAGNQSTVTFTTTKRLKAPVYLYYELQRYYQNHKRYVRSLNSNQLGGKYEAPGSLGTCAPQQYASDSADGTPVPPNTEINPCGLMPYSYFNDSFSLQGFTLDDSNIAWKSDRNSLYGDYAPSFFNQVPRSRGGGAIQGNVSHDQHFLVWMRPGAARTVRKLYARINEDIPAGTPLTLTVSNQYNTYGYGGSKWVILTTNSWVGGHNNALGGIMVTIGSLAFLTAVIFFCSYHLNKKRRGYADPNYLSWNRTSLVH